MIRSFKHKGLRRFFESGSTAGIQSIHSQKLSRILSRLNAAEAIIDIDAPGLHLHQLTGSMQNLWSVRVSGNWRIVFEFKDNDVYVVDYLDYH